MIRERLTGIGVLVLGLLIFFVLIPAGVDRPGSVEHAALAPDFWPRIIAGIIMLMGLFLAIRPAAKEEDEERGDGGGEEGVEAAAEAAGGWTHRLPGLAVALGTLFAFYFLIPYLGMVAPGIAVILGLMVYAGERRWPLGVAVALCVPILLYVFFVHVASVPIPLGVFEGLL